MKEIKRCKFCGKPLGGVRANRKFCGRRCYAKYLRTNPLRSNCSPRMQRPPTLCWTCKHTNRFECSWFSEKAIPVPGWKAIKRPVDGNESYIVVECPNYEKE